MAWQQSDLTTIRAAIASGVRSVTFADGRRQEFQNLDQLLAAEKVIGAALKMQDQAAGGVVRRRFTPYFKSGC